MCAGGAPAELLLTQGQRGSATGPAASSGKGAEAEGGIVGHVVCTRGHVGDRPSLGLGPVAVTPAHQGRGVGTALMHAVLGAADALGEPLVALLGEPAFYGRFGFRPAAEAGIDSPDPAWGEYFQVRTLSAYEPVAGKFAYAAPFRAL